MDKPAQLYKYRPVNEFTQDIISNNRIWFAKPSALNDPFDCQVQIVYQADQQQLRDYTRVALGLDESESKLDSAGNEWLEDLLLQQSLDHQDDLMNSLEEHGRRMVEQNSSLLCLSAKCDDVLMFAHYADNHRGCVLGFTVDWDDEIGRVFPVNYRQAYPKLDYFKMREDGHALMEELLLSKYEPWRYEAEYRVLRYGKPEGLVEFRDDALTSIVFGCLMSDSDKQKMREWNAKRKVPSRLYQADVDRVDYKLNIRALE